MLPELTNPGRIVPAVHGSRRIDPDPDFVQGLVERLRADYDRTGLIELYQRHAVGDGAFDQLMRRVLWKTLAGRVDDGLHVSAGVGFRHLETFEIGRGVFIGAQAYLQGRFDGRCVIGNHVWIGPQAYLDARDLVMGDYVGWGPGARVLGSEHSGRPLDVPVIQTELRIKPVRIEEWADVGTGATLLPGVTVGRGAIVGAGAVVTKDVPPMAIVAGIPARVLRFRADEPGERG